MLQRALVVLQASLSLVLLVGAGMFAQSLSKLEHRDMKLDAANRYILNFDAQAAGYSPAQLNALYPTIEDRFHQIPGLVHVSMSSYTPMEGGSDNGGIQVEGHPNTHKSSSYVKASAEYFDSVGTRVVMGRGFSVRDTPSSPSVAVVNQAFVKTFFQPGENPIGAHVGGPDAPGDFEIVGVVEDTAYSDIRRSVREMLFVRTLQRPVSDKDPIEKAGYLYVNRIVLQTAHPIDNMEQLARQTLAGINPNLSVIKFGTLNDQIAARFTHERMLSRLMTLFGGLALLLAAVGLYGVTAYGVARRTSEIGIRMALGAERSGVVAMVLRGAMLQVIAGLVIGVPAAWYCVRFVSSQLYDMKTLNLGPVGLAIGILIAASFAAGVIPARRAASIEPAVALRSE